MNVVVSEKNQDQVLYADRLVNTLLQHSHQNGLPLDDVVKGVAIALQLLKAIYPDPVRLFQILQEAEGELEMLVDPAGEA